MAARPNPCQAPIHAEVWYIPKDWKIAEYTNGVITLHCWCKDAPTMVLKGKYYQCVQGACGIQVDKDAFDHFNKSEMLKWAETSNDINGPLECKIKWPLCKKCRLAVLNKTVSQIPQQTLYTYLSTKCEKYAGYKEPIAKCGCSSGNTYNLYDMMTSDPSMQAGWGPMKRTNVANVATGSAGVQSKTPSFSPPSIYD